MGIKAFNHLPSYIKKLSEDKNVVDRPSERLLGSRRSKDGAGHHRIDIHVVEEYRNI
jgi:hypothetical protein